MQIFVTGLGAIVMLASIIAAMADCQKKVPLMGKNKSQCGGFFAVLGFSGLMMLLLGIRL